MIKPTLTAAALCFAAATAASALPVSQTTSLRPLNFSDLIQVGQKNKNKNQNHNHDNHNHDNHNHNHGYHHGGRYYGHRYYARPYNLQALGCVVVGPVWYCP
jgi:ABC-type Zn2+ transport system substrate-binding protein/surface adhesin